MNAVIDDKHRVRTLLGDVASDSLRRGESGQEYAERVRLIASQLHEHYLKMIRDGRQ